MVFIQKLMGHENIKTTEVYAAKFFGAREGGSFI